MKREGLWLVCIYLLRKTLWFSLSVICTASMRERYRLDYNRLYLNQGDAFNWCFCSFASRFARFVWFSGRGLIPC